MKKTKRFRTKSNGVYFFLFDNFIHSTHLHDNLAPDDRLKKLLIVLGMRIGTLLRNQSCSRYRLNLPNRIFCMCQQICRSNISICWLCRHQLLPPLHRFLHSMTNRNDCGNFNKTVCDGKMFQI